jgi:hypothetical protein
VVVAVVLVVVVVAAVSGSGGDWSRQRSEQMFVSDCNWLSMSATAYVLLRSSECPSVYTSRCAPEANGILMQCERSLLEYGQI